AICCRDLQQHVRLCSGRKPQKSQVRSAGFNFYSESIGFRV
ncbi:MAG: hypothetical protein, partial [Olavius algarvensis Gamma 3 endosymbiont]